MKQMKSLKNVLILFYKISIIFDCLDLLHYKFHKISLNRGGSNIDSSQCLKNKKAIIHPKSYDEKCWQYTITAVLNYQKIKHNPERIPKIKLFIDQYHQKGISFPQHKEDWKKFESNNKIIALNISYIPQIAKK